MTTCTSSLSPEKKPTSQSPVPSLRLAEGDRLECSCRAAIAFGSCLAISIASVWVTFWGVWSACAGATRISAAARTDPRTTRPGFAIRRERIRPPDISRSGLRPPLRSGAAFRSLVVERPQLVADEVEWHRDRNRDGLGGELAHASSDEELERDQVDHQGEDADREEAGRLKARVAVSRVEGPVAVPPEVARDGDAEGDDRRGDVVDVERPVHQRKDRQVDQVAGGTDHAELHQLKPVAGLERAAPDALRGLHRRGHP